MGDRSHYELMAARIESVLSAYRVPARVLQAVVNPRYVRFDVTTMMGTRLAAIAKLDEEIALALGVNAVRIYREGGMIRMEVPRDRPRQVDLIALMGRIERIPPITAVLGLDHDGAPLVMKLDSPDVAHALIAGATGSGKTVLQRVILISLALYNRPGQVQLVLIDPKARGFEPLVDLPHVWNNIGLIQDIGDAVTVLNCLVAEMERRDRERTRLPHLVIAIDELADLVATGGERVIGPVTRLTQRGREAGIHVIAATQRPSSALIGGMMKANFPVRLVGSVTSADDARVAAGISGTGAETLLGRGDFLLVAKGRPIRFQAAYVNDTDLSRLAAHAANTARRLRRWKAEELRRFPDLPTIIMPKRSVGDVAVGYLGEGWGGVGISPTVAVTVPGTVGIGAHPTPPHRRPLRERYSVAELQEFIRLADGALKRAAELAFGYSDSVTLAIMREAANASSTQEAI